MTDTPHLTVTAPAAGDTEQLADAFRDAIAGLDPSIRTIVSRLIDHHLKTVDLLESINRALVGLDKLDDIQQAQLTMLTARVELLEAQLAGRNADPHSRKVD